VIGIEHPPGAIHQAQEAPKIPHGIFARIHATGEVTEAGGLILPGCAQRRDVRDDRRIRRSDAGDCRGDGTLDHEAHNALQHVENTSDIGIHVSLVLLLLMWLLILVCSLVSPG
jgi:hypothetical protein